MDRAPDFESVGRVFESPLACLKVMSGPIAQLVEQRTLNPEVPGSIPGGLIAQPPTLSRGVGGCLFWGRTQRTAGRGLLEVFRTDGGCPG